VRYRLVPASDPQIPSPAWRGADRLFLSAALRTHFPLFFQVIDKVLVNRGLGTLDVLVIGLAAISIFETALGGLRTYVFPHPANRIDVELGARLFRHLLALPLAYFEARR